MRIRQVGDEVGARGANANVTAASAGEDVELECVVEGGNPAARVRWFSVPPGGRSAAEIPSGHTQRNDRNEEARTFTSVSRLVLPVSKSDNGAAVRCEAEHPALPAGRPIAAETTLNIHCAWLEGGGDFQQPYFLGGGGVGVQGPQK